MVLLLFTSLSVWQQIWCTAWHISVCLDKREAENVEVKGVFYKDFYEESEMGNRTHTEATEQIFKCTIDYMLIYYAYIFIFTHTHLWKELIRYNMAIIIIYVKSLLTYGYDLSAKLAKPVNFSLVNLLVPVLNRSSHTAKKKNCSNKAFPSHWGLD